MNPLHATTQTRTAIGIQSSRGRSGLSIIEVLTSIVVAMIGVFGVMVLIPFAVKQAQIGLDSDAAVMLARNAYSRIEIEGFRNPNNWAVYRGANAPQVTAYSPFASTDTNNDGVIDGSDVPQILSIDPLGILENGSDLSTPAAVTTAYVRGIFPYNFAPVPGSTPLPANLLFASANLGTPTGAIMNQPIAQRMFRSSDDLVFGEAVDDFLGPEQYFDQDTFGNAIRRQSNGRLSWSAIVVPFKDDPLLTNTTRWSYKVYILVFKDRKTDWTDPDGQMLNAMLEPTQNVGPHSPVSTVLLEEGVYVQPTSTAAGVQRDDWVMLINRSLNNFDDGPPPAGIVYAEKGFDRQVAFYRVTSVSDGDGTPNAGDVTTLSSLTLDGPDFNFGTPTSTAPASLIQNTFIVHLKDVVGVYERTFTPEDSSNWTL